MKAYTGGCHCGKVRYEVTMDLKAGMTCNCSHCIKKGFILNFVPENQFKLLSGKDNLTEYRFNIYSVKPVEFSLLVKAKDQMVLLLLQSMFVALIMLT